MRYRIGFTPRAEKEFNDLPRHVQKRVVRWFDLLAENPRREGTKKLEGTTELRRVHASKDYVIIYTIQEKEILVLVVRVGHRREVYRRL